MAIKTSYFAKYRGADGVSIALKSPPGFRGENYPSLFPKWEFLVKYKWDKDEVAYIRAYKEQVLSRLDSHKVWKDLDGKVLLCWERSGSFCHRRIVAKWLEEELGIEVLEILRGSSNR